jgi:hypothetical protein
MTVWARRSVLVTDHPGSAASAGRLVNLVLLPIAGPVGVEGSGAVRPFVGVGTEVVPQPLDETRR